MITLDGKEVGVEVRSMTAGRGEVCLVSNEGAYELAQFARKEDATTFAALIKEQGREYTTDNYRIK